MSIVITGINTTIARNIIKLKKHEQIYGIRIEEIDNYLNADKYVFCQGLLISKKEIELSSDERKQMIYVNYESIKTSIEKIIDFNKKARICVIGSESAYTGSYNNLYAKNKLDLHHFVENCNLKYKHQQLVCISPSLIEDSGMAYNRIDLETVNKRRNEHPMKRLLTSIEIAKLIIFLLYKQPYINKTVIRMNGGNL